MGKYQVNLNSIQKKLPTGFSLPNDFEEFVDVFRLATRGDFGYFNIKYVSPKGMTSIAPKQLVPFLHLPSGDLICFWLSPESPECPIVHISSEGEGSVVARNWNDFLQRFIGKKTGVFDLDDWESMEQFPIRRTGRIQPIPESTKKEFEILHCARDSNSKKTKGSDDLKEKFYKFARSKRFFARDDMKSLYVTENGKKIILETMKMGQYVQIECSQELENALLSWQKANSIKKLKRSKFTVWSNGIVRFEKEDF